MINSNHTYKITNQYGVTFITYDNYAEAREFMKNMAKERGLKLQIKRQEKLKDNKNAKRRPAIQR